MNESSKRTYLSPFRKQQADETRDRITTAAFDLLTRDGFAAMTIDGVAKEAGVSSQSVYAIFGSKPGLVEAVINRVRFGPGYQQLVEQALQSQDPVERLRFASKISCEIYSAERGLLDLMGGIGALSPELAATLKDKEKNRRVKLAPAISLLVEHNLLKPGLDAESAADILYTLTGRDIFRMLIQDCGWPRERYQEWLAETIIAALVG